MYKTIGFNEFCDSFKHMDRDNNFSYQGKRALFDYLENYEEDSGQEIELDVIALCCEYTEYENMEEFQNAYDNDYKTIEDIEEKTQVIKIDDDSFIIQNF